MADSMAILNTYQNGKFNQIQPSKHFCRKRKKLQIYKRPRAMYHLRKADEHHRKNKMDSHDNKFGGR